MKFKSVFYTAIILSLLTSLLLTIVFYIPAGFDFDFDLFIIEVFMFRLFYLTPIFFITCLLAYSFYWLFDKATSFSNVTKNISSIVLSVAITSLSVFLLLKSMESSTNDIYLIPEDYEGDIYVLYNVKGAPEVEVEDGYEVHVINEEGYFATSTPDMDYGTVTDQYYYVDEAGNRTPIDETCVSIFGTGRFSRTIQGEEIEFIYTGLKLTKDHCSEAFMTTPFANQLNEYYVLKTYYGIDTELIY